MYKNYTNNCCGFHASGTCFSFFFKIIAIYQSEVEENNIYYKNTYLWAEEIDNGNRFANELCVETVVLV